MKKLFTLLTTAAMLCNMFAVTSFAEKSDKPTSNTAITAVKTAQWRATESDSATYDLRIHGWSGWETAAYMGFELPENFNAENVGKAELVLDTTSVTNSGTAYLYEADYSAFENGMQYTVAPTYTEKEIMSFTSPSNTGEFKIDVTDYIKSIKDKENVAFRIDVKSQNNNTNWNIGSCTNSGNAPKIVIGDDDNTIKNASFSDGDVNWTITNSENMTVSDGRLNASGTDYEAQISQTVGNMENGTYTLNAYLTNDTTDGICYLYAKTNGHTMASTSIPISNNESKVTVPGIIVEDGKCDIGLYIKGSQTLTLDKLSFAKSEESRIPFLKGREISKLTYVEDRGGKFFDENGQEGDALQIMAENGFNFARIRVLNNPGKGHGNEYYLPEGYQDPDDCLAMARRAKDKGMQIEFTFAYSDTWSDGENQLIPYDWRPYIEENNLTGDELATYLEGKIYEFTKDMMLKLIEQGTCPEYVSIGNEMQYGLLYNNHKNNNGFYNKSDYLSRFVNAGARAVRETSPESKIVLHSDHGGELLSRRKTFINALANIDFDVIGVSYYPYYTKSISIDDVVNEFNTLINRYNKDVIIMETGYNWNETKPDGWDGQLQDSGYYQNIYGETQSGQRAFLTELYAKLKQVLGGRCIGDLYWDPVMVYDGGTGKIGWAIDEATDTTQGNVVPNSTIFDFEGKAVDGQKAMKYNTNASDKINITGTVSNDKGIVKNTEITFTVNGEKYNVSTDRFGKYIVSVPYPKENKFDISAKGCTEKYTPDAPYYGVFVENINFETYADGTEADSKNYISKVDGTIENSMLKYDVEYRTDIANAKFYVAIYDDRGNLVAISDKNRDNINIKNESKSYTIKAMLWNRNLKPLCNVESKTVER